MKSMAVILLALAAQSLRDEIEKRYHWRAEVARLGVSFEL
jgi:hypothetical protein